jgi:hypothetical protein
MYVVSLSIRPTVKLNIHNQCLNVDFVSPTYIAYERSECHRAPDYKVCTGDKTLSAFAIDGYCFSEWLTYTSFGSLIYELQRRKSYESIEFNQGTSRVAYLLVVWKILQYKKLDADILLVKHDKGFDWNEYNLKELYHKNTGRFRWFYHSATETWSLDNNVALNITSEIMTEGLVLNITISEIVGGNYAKIPAHIDLKR